MLYIAKYSICTSSEKMITFIIQLNINECIFSGVPHRFPCTVEQSYGVSEGCWRFGQTHALY